MAVRLFFVNEQVIWWLSSSNLVKFSQVCDFWLFVEVVEVNMCELCGSTWKLVSLSFVRVVSRVVQEASVLWCVFQ